jgi:hypothetical protein
MKVILFFLLILPLQVVFSQPIESPVVLDNNRFYEILKHNGIKREKLTIDNFDSTGKIINRTWETIFNSDGKKIKTTGIVTNEYDYDSLGNIIKFVLRDKNGKMVETQISQYDSTNKLIKEIHNFKNKNSYFNLYRYKGNCDYVLDSICQIKRISTREFDSTTNTYYLRTFSKDSILFYEHIYICNKQNQIVESRYSDYEHNYFLIETYNYDVSGNRIEEIQYNRERGILKKGFSTFSDRNLLIETKWYDSKGLIISKLYYQYF